MLRKKILIPVLSSMYLISVVSLETPLSDLARQNQLVANYSVPSPIRSNLIPNASAADGTYTHYLATDNRLDPGQEYNSYIFTSPPGIVVLNTPQPIVGYSVANDDNNVLLFYSYPEDPTLYYRCGSTSNLSDEQSMQDAGVDSTSHFCISYNNSSQALVAWNRQGSDQSDAVSKAVIINADGTHGPAFDLITASALINRSDKSYPLMGKYHPTENKWVLIQHAETPDGTRYTLTCTSDGTSSSNIAQLEDINGQSSTGTQLAATDTEVYLTATNAQKITGKCADTQIFVWSSTQWVSSGPSLRTRPAFNKFVRTSSNKLIHHSINRKGDYILSEPVIGSKENITNQNSKFIKMLAQQEARIEYLEPYHNTYGGEAYVGTGLALQDYPGDRNFVCYCDNKGYRRKKKIHNNRNSSNNTTCISLLQGTDNLQDMQGSITDKFSPIYKVTGAAEIVSNFQIRTTKAQKNSQTTLYEAYHQLITSSGNDKRGIMLYYNTTKTN